jgi:SOS-response transcriptional repressor LexA
MTPVTIVEQKILNAIKAYQDEFGFSPTYRELMLATNYTSPAPIQRVIYQLRDKGRVTFMRGQARTLRIVKEQP